MPVCLARIVIIKKKRLNPSEEGKSLWLLETDRDFMVCHSVVRVLRHSLFKLVCCLFGMETEEKLSFKESCIVKIVSKVSIEFYDVDMV